MHMYIEKCTMRTEHFSSHGFFFFFFIFQLVITLAALFSISSRFLCFEFLFLQDFPSSSVRILLGGKSLHCGVFSF